MAARKKIEKSDTVTVKEQTVTKDTSKKYRYDFKSYKEYTAYKGPKG